MVRWLEGARVRVRVPAGAGVPGFEGACPCDRRVPAKTRQSMTATVAVAVLIPRLIIVPIHAKSSRGNSRAQDQYISLSPWGLRLTRRDPGNTPRGYFRARRTARSRLGKARLILRRAIRGDREPTNPTDKPRLVVRGRIPFSAPPFCAAKFGPEATSKDVELGHVSSSSEIAVCDAIAATHLQVEVQFYLGTTYSGPLASAQRCTEWFQKAYSPDHRNVTLLRHDDDVEGGPRPMFFSTT